MLKGLEDKVAEELQKLKKMILFLLEKIVEYRIYL
jgi:hypothetical protein